ncbi:MAG: methionine--tRNA ligase subunit beta [Candidatus Micrarchaeota archaeon]|nr:methionine--tRNA ligase subunit beta [Candidatus Micrarchaeota archaeon]
MVSFEHFAQLDIRVGKIIAAEEHTLARKPMYRLTVSLGPELGERTIIAGIKDRYAREELVGKKIVCVTNLDPKMIAGLESHGMILAAEGDGVLSVIVPDRDLPEGSQVR